MVMTTSRAYQGALAAAGAASQLQAVQDLSSALLLRPLLQGLPVTVATEARLQLRP